MLLAFLYFLFVHATLLIPGYAFVRKFIFKSRKHLGLAISLGYASSIVFYGLLSTFSYVLKLSPWLSRGLSWAVIIIGLYILIKDRLWADIYARARFPLACLLSMSLFSLLFISLPFNAPKTIVPDPQPEAGRNYNSFNVKVINVAHTQANDNYVPYRQAQFFINRSDPAKDSFINEWGVTFFERTPLMGAVTANYFNLLGDKPPIDYIWSASAKDNNHTYKKFQILSQILNSLLIIPGFYLLAALFKKRTAYLSLLFLITNIYFLYNSFFSWPKSLVSFFILCSWLLLLERKPNYTFMAGVVSGFAYLTHDLAVLYIGASFVYLLIQRRFREVAYFIAPIVLIALPWLITASVVYHKASSFIYYPLSTKDIPQPAQYHQVVEQFKHTSPFRLLKIRIDNLIYLLTPYQLLTSEGGQNIATRIWTLSLYSIPGALGLGLIIPAILGILSKLRSWALASLMFVPVIMCTLVIGWPKGLGALHFAEAVVLLLTGYGVLFLSKLKSRAWIIAAFTVNILQLVFFISNSYRYATGKWFTVPGSLVIVILMSLIVIVSGYFVFRLSNSSENKLMA